MFPSLLIMNKGRHCVINLETFHALLAQQEARGYNLNARQKEAVDFGEGPLWLLAGPGSGKSEVLVTRTLKLLCVDGVLPRSILLTTFTTKAARNLEDRLASYLSVLKDAEASLKDVDLSDLRIGTLHSLCNDILQEFRATNYKNVRLLDDVEQNLFIYRRAAIATHQDITFWNTFDYAVPDWRNRQYVPNRWKRTKAAVLLFNRIAEDRVDIAQMLAAGGQWAVLADFYVQYRQALGDYYRCDFAHLQALFLDFLNSPQAARFLEGDPEKPDRQPPLRHILVDEYQDTNPIQERIYLALAGRTPHNLTVCGDDDQSLYRFRGGNVACMVNFDKACQATYGITPYSLSLVENYRSHALIVDFFNDYIGSFPEMTAPGVRAPGKPAVVAQSSIGGNHPAVSWLTRKLARDLPNAVADLIADHFVKDGIISDLNQCVLLMRSTKDSPGNAGPFLQALQARGIPVYNPRSKSFMEAEEVQCLLAALVHVVDRNFVFTSYKDPQGRTPEFVDTIRGWIATLVQIGQQSQQDIQPLIDYIAKSNDVIKEMCKANPGALLDVTLMDILYRLLAHEPFLTWRKDPSQNFRLSKVTRLFESYHSFNLDVLRSDAQGLDLDPSFFNRFYYMFLSYLIEAGIDDDEDEDVIVPQGYLPLMTIHQSKGLEFPFVIVAQIGQGGRTGAAQRLEIELAPFRQDLYARPQRPPETLATEDDIRLLYVAYSRAQYALILVAAINQIGNNVAVPGRDAVEFRRNTPVI